MNIPEGLKYTKDHEWIKIEGDIATIGITDFAQSELGDIVYVDITTVGQEVKQHEIFGTVEAVKTVSDLFYARIRKGSGSERYPGWQPGKSKRRCLWRRLDDQNPDLRIYRRPPFCRPVQGTYWQIKTVNR